jgi:FtsZ-binding cell division protein ZapB
MHLEHHTDAARRSMEMLSELAAKMRESEARCSAQADDAEAAARNLRGSAKAYQQHQNILQNAINSLAGQLDAEKPVASGPEMDVEELALRIQQRNAALHPSSGPFASKSAY